MTYCATESVNKKAAVLRHTDTLTVHPHNITSKQHVLQSVTFAARASITLYWVMYKVSGGGRERFSRVLASTSHLPDVVRTLFALSYKLSLVALSGDQCPLVDVTSYLTVPTATSFS